MISKIVKRDGRAVEFDLEKITQAIYKAAHAIGGNDYAAAEQLADKVREYLEAEDNDTPSVEHVQDTVEKILIENGHARTAKEFILYRAERTRVREMNTKLMKIYEDLTFKSAKDNDVKRENANIDGDTAMGTMLKYGSEGAKEFYQMYILNPKHAKAHREGDIHIHDLDFLTLTTTCCQIDLIKLFKDGFSTGHGFIREPNDISTYGALACIAIQSNQNDQHGGQSVPNFDYGMAPGVQKTYNKRYRMNLARGAELLADDENAKDDINAICDAAEEATESAACLESTEEYIKKENELLTEKYGEKLAGKLQRFARKHAEEETDRATFQAMEAVVHNLNTMHSRAGAQVPFSSINYGTDTSPEGRMVIKNILFATEKGLGNGETPIFPVHIFKVKEGVNYNPEDPNYDLFKLSFRVSAKRLFPNYAFIDAPYNLAYYKPGHPETEVSYMGCRTRVIGNKYDPSREITFGRGNLSFTSINLPRLAILANKNIDFFFEQLDRMLDLCIDQILERFEIQCQKCVRNYPFLMGQGVWIDSDKLSIDDEVREVLKHGTLSIGFIGLAETLVALIGKHHGESEEAQRLGLEIVTFMRKKLDRKSDEMKLNFTCLATPAEGLSGRFVRMDKKRFGVIKGVTDREYYTNSFHIPV
ncbi:MAG: anaerobic ribonucleoside triphosphate reductase, partial [Ruminococcus sp.]|nr:anaerobic ribonucleoside triphosphate reductase [Ruminococcus sp.]